ncbi:hypothetical protein DYBT9275_05605 [Dyadobacter sp. CECT 9275]|uniref:DUF2958 domain-containing protein n=1 Tax=Dyadobacter helix TaxID=2822344 RepID=A0A916JH65_9BACT|nr:DUF2958 domain-containing protein [Dyadobacter sp. CECT 9275]CAG5016673.1 hypothetical protein DYBT9275_05605 [Dyadobacter sp. CECT 9275]
MAAMIPDNLKEIMIHNAQEVQNGLGKDHEPVVKLHSRYGKAIWLLSELDPANQIAFGLCDLGTGTPELSYVSITDLESIKHARLKVPMVEMDQAFEGKYPMSVYVAAAKISKRITEDDQILRRFLSLS